MLMVKKKNPLSNQEIENSCLKQYEELTEEELRIQLAAAYRIVERLGWSYLIFGHLTVRVPGPEKHFLINPFGLMYDEVTASNLVKINLQGDIVESSKYDVNPAGFIIHSAIHSARKDAHCVMHTHTKAGMAMASLKKGLLNIDFSGSSFYNRISDHGFEGVTLREEECETLAKDLGKNHAMILKNHGLLTTGKTIADALITLYKLEDACQVQLLARGTAEELEEIPINVVESHISELKNVGNTTALAFQALVRRELKHDSSFKY